jgi:hypothetical protein
MEDPLLKEIEQYKGKKEELLKEHKFYAIDEFESAFIGYTRDFQRSEWIPKEGYSYIRLYEDLNIPVLRYSFRGKNKLNMKEFIAMFTSDCYEHVRLRRGVNHRTAARFKSNVVYEELEDMWENKIPKMMKIESNFKNPNKKYIHFIFEKEKSETQNYHDMFEILRKYPEAIIG